jgi:hypothetical protein
MASVLLMGLAPVAAAFHEGGVGFCEGCHELHAEDGNPDGLLRGSDISSTCLRCHAEAREPHNVLSADGSSFTPGGDFYWLERSYLWTEDEGEGEGEQVYSSPGHQHGHNVTAVDYGLTADPDSAAAPGGSYPAAELSCASCHDPHGEITGEGGDGLPISGSSSYADTSPDGAALGSYRLLGGVGYAESGTSFSQAAPVALAPFDWTETNENHVDYGSGMSEWCANCHPGMHEGVAAQHPAGESARFSAQTAEIYGSYVRTGDFTGSAAYSYLALVPFERGVADLDLLDPSSSSGPEAGASNVMCLTCHRAHASAYRDIGRWDFTATMLVDSHPQDGDVGAGPEDAWNSYYGRDITAKFGPYQRSLCNKCHAQD